MRGIHCPLPPAPCHQRTSLPALTTHLCGTHAASAPCWTQLRFICAYAAQSPFGWIHPNLDSILTLTSCCLCREQAFLDKFTKVAPSTLAPPSFPSEFAAEDRAAVKGKTGEEAAPASGMPDKLTFSFFLPHATIGKGKKVLDDQIS